MSTRVGLLVPTFFLLLFLNAVRFGAKLSAAIAELLAVEVQLRVLHWSCALQRTVLKR